MENILKRPQIKKFGWYGLLKNLKFFEPYLLLYLIFSQLSFTEIGVLYAIREAIVYIFEIPSGVFADRYGKKTELYICFSFYILSFIGFYLASSFVLFLIPMVLYGLGEAFRSGTHKAMIMEYLDQEDLKISKRQVYGYTRAYSNIGSTISSIFGVGLILFVPDLNILFLVAIIPYIAVIILIMTYPSYMNNRIENTFTWKGFLKENIDSIKYAFNAKKLRRYLFDTSTFQAVFKSIKDYIQPLIYTAGITFILIKNVSLDQNIKVYIGLTYATAQFISIFVSKNAYRIRKILPTDIILFGTWIMTALFAILLGVFDASIIIILIAIQAFYIALNIRKPYMVQRIGDATENNKRASVLSIESQLTSLMIIILAPILGLISDSYSIETMFLCLGIGLLIYACVQYLFKRRTKEGV
jgi:MFS family permease